MSKRYRVVVAGVGKRGLNHASHFMGNPRFELVGICGRDKAKLEAASSKLGGTPISTDIAGFAKSSKPDIFCFCTPPSVRQDLIKIGIDAGAKLIAFEKPIAMSSAEAMQTKKLLDAAKVKAVVSHQHRYGIHYQKVRQIIASGALGKIHTVYGTSTGWMMHMLSHLVDYMRWYNDNAEASWVMAQAAGGGKFKDVHSSPDYIGGFIQFANGVRGVVECGAGAPNVPEVDYWWRKCRIGAQGPNGFAETLTGGGWRAVTKDGASSGEGCMNYDLDMPGYIQEMADWLDQDGKVHSCHFDSAYKGFEIMMAFCRSVLEGGQVALPLTSGMDELGALKGKLQNSKVLLSMQENAKEYGG